MPLGATLEGGLDSFAIKATFYSFVHLHPLDWVQ